MDERSTDFFCIAPLSSLAPSFYLAPLPPINKPPSKMPEISIPEAK